MATFRAALDAAAIAALPTNPALFFQAIRWGRVDAVKLLLSLGASPNAEEDGVPALACIPHHLILRALLAAGADVSRGGEAALRGAVHDLRDLRAIRLLLDAGVPATTLTERDWISPFLSRGLIRLLAEAGVDFGPTLVLMAGGTGVDPIVKYLLKLRGKRHWTDAEALHSAVRSARLGSVKSLLAAGFSPDALHGVVEHSKADITRALLRAGARVDEVDEAKQTPLMRLASVPVDNLAVARALLAAGASVTRKDADGRTALTLARLQGHAALAALLRQHGAKDQPQFESEVAPKEAELARVASVSAANHARALAFFEARHGKAGRGKSMDDTVGHAARLSGKRVVIWSLDFPPDEFAIGPEANWKYDRGQDPGPPKRARARPSTASLAERLAAVEARAQEGGMKLGPGVSNVAISEAEKALQTTFPEPLREWLRRHGSTRNVTVNDQTDLLSLAHMVKYGRVYFKQSPEVTETDWGWGPGLVPLAQSGNDHVSLDLRPGSKAPGQVLMVWQDDMPRVEAKTFLDRLDGLYWGQWE